MWYEVIQYKAVQSFVVESSQLSFLEVLYIPSEQKTKMICQLKNIETSFSTHGVCWGTFVTACPNYAYTIPT